MDSKLLRKVAVRVSLERHPLRAHIELLVFYLRLEDRLIAYGPYNLIDDRSCRSLLLWCLSRQREAGQQRQ